MHSIPIPIVGNSTSRSHYQFGTASDYSDNEGMSSGRSSPSAISSFGAPLSRTSTASDASRSIYAISELLSLASSAGSRSQISRTSSSLRDAFPQIMRARVDDLSDHLSQLALSSNPRPRRSRKNGNKPNHQEGGAASKPSKRNNNNSKWKPHHNPNHPSSNPSSVEDSSNGWTTVHLHHGHGQHSNYPQMSSSPPVNAKPKRSAHGFRPSSSWMSNSTVRGSQIDAMASWR